MIKTSVKKPFTVLVAVIMVIVLGVVSLTNMTADLLPEISLPYLIVVSTYPGASPERVEADLVRPLENALGTISGVTGVYSTCAENYGMVQLEFEEDTDMDSTLVKVSSALQEAAASLPELCSTPSIIEISMDMMATMYVSVSREDYDVYQLSNFVTNTVQPYLEAQEGVAQISPVGIVEQSLHVQLDQAKIDSLNETLLESISAALAAAAQELDAAEQQVTEGKAELEKAQSSFGQTMAETLFGQIDQSVSQAADEVKNQLDILLTQIESLSSYITDSDFAKTLDSLILQLESIAAQLDRQNLSAEELLLITGSLRSIVADLQQLTQQLSRDMESLVSPESLDLFRSQLTQIEKTLEGLTGAMNGVPDMLAGLEDAYAGLTQAQLEAAVGFATASAELSSAQAALTEARAQYESAKAQALDNANVGQLLSISTLSQLIYAQNFSMPAGYIQDAQGTSWLLKVGNSFETPEEISDALLVHMDGIGDVRLSDVATVTIIDNSGDSFARLNGQQSVILSIYKDGTHGTNETANNCLDAFAELESKYPGTRLVSLMNQGSYIDIIVKSVLSSMVLGALLAIIILALFLKDVKPTLVVSISIPLSVLFTLVLMYFTGLSLNMMTLSGLALGIGMLVDNSVVVMENIYRLQSRGVSAARAAVQGTRQVAGAVISSTLTTVCVFLPLVFTTGMVRELLLPLGLCIGYCLMASLIVALTVVPAAASTVLRNARHKEHKLFDHFLESYGKFLNWCLDHKAVPLSASIGLLAICVAVVLNMGIVLIPEMTSTQIQISVTTPEELTREESYTMADDLIATLLTVDGVDTLGVMDSGSSAGLFGGMSAGSDSYGSYQFYVVLPEDTAASRVNEILDNIRQVTQNHPCSVDASAGSIDDLTSLLGSGLSVRISGSDLATMEQISEKVAQIVAEVEGYTDIQSSFSNGEPAIQLSVDKDAAMAKGLTVAQIYLAISDRLTTTANVSGTVTLNGVTMEVTVQSGAEPLTVESLMQLQLQGSALDESGGSVVQNVLLSEVATVQQTTTVGSISRENLSRYVTVSASVADGYNATLLSRDLSQKLDAYTDSGALPYGYSVSLEGESSTVNEMVGQMVLLLAMGCLFIYLVMVAQFQSLRSPFIVLFTVPLAFTGGIVGLIVSGQQLSLLSLMGFAVLMGTVVNNGIVFVDYVNQLRIGGLDRRNALIAAGKTRMRPILMTALTTILALFQMIFADDMAGQLGGGMAVVIVGGLAYATVMTLIIVPVIYDCFFKKQPHHVDIGSDDLDDVPDDAAEYIAQLQASEIADPAPDAPQ